MKIKEILNLKIGGCFHYKKDAVYRVIAIDSEKESLTAIEVEILKSPRIHKYDFGMLTSSYFGNGGGDNPDIYKEMEEAEETLERYFEIINGQ